MFRDRADAADRLAERLAAWAGQKPLVLGIPRGGVPMARTIADRLGGEVDVVLVRKLRAPHQPELAVGSVDESGWTHHASYAADAGADEQYLAAERERQLTTIRKRRAGYTPLQAPIDPAGRVVIVVDDGLATGSTMIAALHGLRQRKPARLVCAVPVAPPDTLAAVRPYADEVVCLEAPRWFEAVGQFYRTFDQVSDDEVVAALVGHAGPSPGGG